MDAVEAVKWYRKAAEQGHADAQYKLGLCYAKGDGVPVDAVEAVNWFRKAAEQGSFWGQCGLGWCYGIGNGTPKDEREASGWYRKAANQGDAGGQFRLGWCYETGCGVPKDCMESYKWYSLAATQGDEDARRRLSEVKLMATSEQIAEAQHLAREFIPHKAPDARAPYRVGHLADSHGTESGTGFFITEDGFLATTEHVVKNAKHIRLVTSAGFISAEVVRVDAANDLALLKVEGKFAPLPVVSSRTVKMGSTVATVGFPNIGLQGFAPKLAKGEIAALSGAQDDPRYFKISVPVQPGNSGGALVDERGNVVGVVSAKLNVAAAVATSGALPENLNYAVKSSFLLSFLESVPEVAAKLKEPNTKDRKFEDVVKSAEQAVLLVLVY
jgi:uncharacterized protein